MLDSLWYKPSRAFLRFVSPEKVESVSARLKKSLYSSLSLPPRCLPSKNSSSTSEIESLQSISFSLSSETLKPASRPSEAKLSLTILRQKASMVEICVAPRLIICPSRCSFKEAFSLLSISSSPSLLIASEIPSAILTLSSFDASLVKVTISFLEMSSLSTITRFTSRLVSVNVLPLPAPAEIRRSLRTPSSPKNTAQACAGVSLFIFKILSSSSVCSGCALSSSSI